jgi:predicted metalloprotease with PDZ domain
VTYGFDDVVAALNAVTPYDWAGFLKARIADLAPQPPLDGLARGGWRLVYADKPTPFFKASEGQRSIEDLSYSVGLVLKTKDGEIASVLWGGPAFEAGLNVGSKLLSVNGVAYDAERLERAITEAKSGGPLDLIVKNGEHYQMVAIDYRGGLRYPRLERIAGAPDRLSEIFSPRR